MCVCYYVMRCMGTCHSIYVEVREQAVGVNSLGSMEQSHVTVPSGKCLYTVRHLSGPNIKKKV